MKEHVIIGKDRSVSVPNSLKKIGIQYDHNVNTITFDCPRYPDEDSSIDMSRMHIFLNYMLPDKTTDCSIMENVVVDEEDPTIMHFDWIVKRNHTRVNGVLSTLICIKDTDTEGNEIYHWNTDLFQSFSVGNGMECSEQIVDMNPDIITQLLVRMGEVDNRTSTEAMQGYVNTYMNQNPPQPTDEQASAGINAYMNQNPPTPTDEQASTAINAYMTEHAQSCIDDYLTDHPVTPTEEQMKNGVAANSEMLQSSVDDYLGRNPLQLDEGLTDNTKAAPADKVGEIRDDVAGLKSDIDEQEKLYSSILQITSTANLMNPDKLETGKYINQSGSITDRASTSTSEFIPVDASIPLRNTTAYNQILAQYNSEKIIIGYTSTFSSAEAVTLNPETKYIRISAWNNTLPFMVYQSDKTMSYVEYGKYSENVRRTVWIYTSDTEEDIYLKMYNAYKTKNCNVYWERGTYEFSTIFELLKTKYGRNTAYELPIGGNCRYFFNGSTIVGTGISDDSNVIENSSVFGTWRTSQSYELHDGIIIANHLIYCVHEEASSQAIPYNIKYSNMRMYHNTITEDYDLTYGLRKCIGSGTGLYPSVEVENCFFQTDYGRDIGWHGHSKDDKTTFYLNIHNCYFSHGISTDRMSTNETCELLFKGNSTPIIPTSNHNGVNGWKVVAWNNEKRSS